MTDELPTLDRHKRELAELRQRHTQERAFLGKSFVTIDADDIGGRSFTPSVELIAGIAGALEWSVTSSVGDSFQHDDGIIINVDGGVRSHE